MSDNTSPERLLAILEMFEREKRPLSSKELSDLCRIPASTCHNLVHILLKNNYIYQTGNRKDLYPTRKLYDMGAVLLEHDMILRRLLPAMDVLRETTRETIILGKRQRGHIVYLEVLDSPEVIRYSARPGDIKPLSSCIGKTTLSVLKPDEIRALLEEFPLRELTDKTITDFDAVMADLELGRQRGFFTTHGENVADVTALAVPISLNNELFGLAVAGPSHRVYAHFDRISGALKDAQSGLAERPLVPQR
jgi:DNA-binding IclR family transcriptional regulator